MPTSYHLNANPLVRYLEKDARDFTREDIISYVDAHNIRMVNFRYVGGDGRLKTLNFVITNRRHLEDILTFGERVDGSSLFPFMGTGSSDLYVVPRYRTAFENPFSEEPSLEILCSFFNHEGKPLELSPEYVLSKAITRFREETGLDMKFLGELEYYVFCKSTGHFLATDQKGYHESEPFSKFERMRKKALRLIAACGGIVKYGHSEVGNFLHGDIAYEQHEIEFQPTDPEFAAEQLLVAKWVLRMLALELGVELSFAPKITVGKAGSGMHFHMAIEKDGVNLVRENGVISDLSKRAIAGILEVADGLTAFGNTVPTSYFRLVPNQEAPTNICWGARNRSVLVRVPLGWAEGQNMASVANPGVNVGMVSGEGRQTFEFRVPDGSANVHLIIAGLIMAVLHGMRMPDAVAKADSLYVEGNIAKSGLAGKLKPLPDSCVASAKCLDATRAVFESDGVFPPQLIDFTIQFLNRYEDASLRDNLSGNPDGLLEVATKYMHCQ